jgi:mono/diheme cytochrome c family protein
VRARLIALGLATAVLGGLSPASHIAGSGDPRRGEYLARAGGCLGCHTEARKGATPFAGDRALKTPFGTFYGPNITPHADAGIGRWSEADFVRAMRQGIRPDGANLFPAFPYTSFTKVTDADLSDLWAWLRTLPPSSRPSQPHDLKFPFGWRFAVTFWKWLFFVPGPLREAPGASAALSRGEYLVKALGHCGECHTPRNFLGGPARGRFLAGGRGIDDKKVPNLTPAGLELWSDANLKEFFLTGVTPDGDTVSETMDEVIRSTTSKLATQDLSAVIAYLRSLPPIPDEAR